MHEHDTEIWELRRERERLQREADTNEHMMSEAARRGREMQRVSLNRLISAARELVVEYDEGGDRDYITYKERRDGARERLERVDAELERLYRLNGTRKITVEGGRPVRRSPMEL